MPSLEAGESRGFGIRNRFHSLPVVRGGKLVGIITTLDVMRLVDDEEVELEDYGKV